MKKITSIDQLKAGMTILAASGSKYHVYAICGEFVWLSKSTIFTIEELSDFTIEKPKWEPKVGDMYYYPYLGDESFAGSTYFVANCNSDLINLKNGLCFQTEEEAISAGKKMLKALKDE